jgi:broad specificity phosphatase PhoE
MIYYVRHASQDVGDDTNVVKYPYPKDAEETRFFRGWSMEGLSQEGEQIAAQLAKYFKDKKLDKIYTSDLPRAMETARFIAELTNLSAPTADSRLRTWNNGMLDGLVVTPALQQYQESYRLQSPSDAIPGGEPYNDFRNKIADFVAEAHPRMAGKNVAVVTHHRVFELLGIPVERPGEVADFDAKKMLFQPKIPKTTEKLSKAELRHVPTSAPPELL